MIYGENRIGYDLSALGNKKFKAFNPATGKELQNEFIVATHEEINLALEKAQSAFPEYSSLSGATRAAFLKTIAEEIMALGDELIKTAAAETGLPESRITGERGRTVGQIAMFADLIREGSWVGASLDTANPERKPVPKPDIRRMSKPVGPVVVFSASNFPLAFSTAGGDTVSALAAGNPVIVKAHPSHPSTNFLVGEAINKAAMRTGMPDGIFSTLYSNTYELGLSLVKHPLTKSVAFTGSYHGGMALYKAAQEREEPIPIFAEMGSVNPVILLPEKIRQDAKSVANKLAGSITAGAGQFCTNPGLMASVKGEVLDQFLSVLSSEIKSIAGQTMLNAGIWNNFNKKRTETLKEKGVNLISEKVEPGDEQMKAYPAIATVNYSDFKKNPNLQDEVFGPFSLVVICENERELQEFASSLKGQLTVSVFAAGNDFKQNRDLFNILEQKAGRSIINGVPTGVEVCASMQHGGPFPASTDARFTSVGTEAIKRFVRPVAFQDFPDELLPAELQSANPLHIWRKVNGELTQSGIK